MITATDNRATKFLGRSAKPCRKCGGQAHYVNRLGGVVCASCRPPHGEGDVLMHLTIWAGVWDRVEWPANATQGDETMERSSGLPIVAENAMAGLDRVLSESEAEEIAGLFDLSGAAVAKYPPRPILTAPLPPPLMVGDHVDVSMETFGGFASGEAVVCAVYADDCGQWLVNVERAGRVVATGVSAKNLERVV